MTTAADDAERPRVIAAVNHVTEDLVGMTRTVLRHVQTMRERRIYARDFSEEAREAIPD